MKTPLAKTRTSAATHKLIQETKSAQSVFNYDLSMNRRKICCCCLEISKEMTVFNFLSQKQEMKRERERESVCDCVYVCVRETILAQKRDN